MASRRCAITSAARTWCSRQQVSRVERRASCAALQGGPAAENVTKQDGVLVLKPVERLRERVFQGARESVGAPHGVAAPHGDGVRRVVPERAWGGAAAVRGGNGRGGCAAMRAGSAASVGSSLRAAGGKRFAVPRAGQGIDGQEDEEVRLVRKAKTMGPLLRARPMAIGLPCAPLAPGTPPRLKGFWRVLEDVVLSLRSPPPVSPHQVWHRPSRGRRRPHMTSGVSGCMSALPGCGTVGPRDRRAGCCAGMRGSRWRGRPCVCVDEHQRTRGREDRFVSIVC